MRTPRRQGVPVARPVPPWAACSPRCRSARVRCSSPPGRRRSPVQSELETATASRSREQTAAESPPGSRIVCRQAISAEETIEHFAIRHEIFVAEQHIFRGSDRDAHDERDSVVRLLGYCDGVAAGSVRLYELDRPAGIWQGGRLPGVSAVWAPRGGGPPVGWAGAGGS